MIISYSELLDKTAFLPKLQVLKLSLLYNIQ